MSSAYMQGNARFRSGNFRGSSRSSNRSVPIPLEPLKEGHRMDPQERTFLEAAERGDKHSMMRCLQEKGKVNVNCTNIIGRSAIQIAVDNENVEIVEMLLQQESIKIGDALLYAIREGVYRIVEMLIDHPSITRGMLGGDWMQYKSTGEESSDYPPDISPVILAAHCNQFEILQLLLSRGAKIDKPHALICSCQRCKKELADDSLRHSLLRIHTYRALSSPAWISLTSSDPVLTAFKLSWELEHLAMRENEFKDSYAELSEQCKKYSCDLLNQCRSSEEVIAVLNRETDSDDEEDDYYVDTENITLSRLKLALKYEQKQFVAHPHCQQLLASIWYNGLPGWRKRNVATKTIMIVSLIALMPVMATYYLILPRSRIGQLLRTPFMKFMYHSASFGVFLFLLILVSTKGGNSTEDSTDARHRSRQMQRGPPPTPLEWLIVFYVLGFIWGECKQLWDEGLKAYVRQWWNWLDFIMLSLYLATFSLRLVAFTHSLDQDVFGPTYLDRTDWPDADPTLISEGVFAIANVFSFARIIFLFQANYQLGPLQISLGCMLIDIGKFMFIFFLVITSFACGLNQLYYYYSNDVVSSRSLASLNTTDAIETTAEPAGDFENAFYPLSTSFRTLYWSLFGLIPLAVLEIKLKYTRVFGKLLFGLYNLAARILLLNMLIAMMTKSLQKIVDHADREWKFARSKLWMGYFDEGCTLPPPFNLIISPKSIYYCLRKLKNMFWSCKAPEESENSRRKSVAEGTIKLLPVDNSLNNQGKRYVYVHTVRNGDAKSVVQKKDPIRYQDVMRRLVNRFIHQMKKEMRQDGISEDDLLEMRQDISSLRYELREDRRIADARAASHMESLRHEILRSLHNSGHGPAPRPPRHDIVQGGRDSPPPSEPSASDFDFMKRDIIQGLRSEIREMTRELLAQNPPRSAVDSSLALASTDLYQTHLYTQL